MIASRANFAAATRWTTCLRDALAWAALGAGLLLVACGGQLPRISLEGPATVARVMPHGALLTFPDGAFIVVPLRAVGPFARAGAVVDATKLRGALPADTSW